MAKAAKGPKFTGSPTQLKINYEHGKTVTQIMEETGEDYGSVMGKLRQAGTALRTGGPATRCRHTTK